MMIRFRSFFAVFVISAVTPIVSFAAIDRFIEVTPGIFRGGQPETFADFEMLKNEGIRTVIYLRSESPAREKYIVTSLGMNFKAFPINPFTYPDENTVNGALRVLTDPAAQPVFVHCQHGKDRTGLVVGLYRVHHEGWSPDDAYDEMRRIGFSPLLVGLKRYFDDHSGRVGSLFWNLIDGLVRE
jgi:tyrosine-protein phosphatase SIW14